MSDVARVSCSSCMGQCQAAAGLDADSYDKCASRCQSKDVNCSGPMPPQKQQMPPAPQAGPVASPMIKGYEPDERSWY